MNVASIFSKVQSHALALGVFDRVDTAEPKAAPGSGVTCSIWFGSLQPVALHSGLTATSARLELQVRAHGSMLAEPIGDIDPALVTVVDTLMDAYSDDFTLDGDVAFVDLLGAHGTPLQAEGGYLEIDGKIFRVITVTLPMIINDAWSQTA